MFFRNLTVLTGTFRKFHNGHLYLITKAYELGLPVYVLLNSDQGIKQLNKLPEDNYLTRKNKVLKTGLVDNILWFHTNQKRWLSILRPKNFIMGDDHKIEELSDKGIEFIQNVHLIKRIPGLSSTIEINKENK